MSEVVTIYRFEYFSTPESGQTYPDCSLLPWRDEPGLSGRDDGGRTYVLPQGYVSVSGPEGFPAVQNDEGIPCGLMLHNGRPLLIDSGRRRAYLLEPVKKISTYRELNGLSLAELAERLSVEPKTLYEWENLEREPDAEILGRIASILGCSPLDLV